VENVVARHIDHNIAVVAELDLVQEDNLRQVVAVVHFSDHNLVDFVIVYHCIVRYVLHL